MGFLSFSLWGSSAVSQIHLCGNIFLDPCLPGFIPSLVKFCTDLFIRRRTAPGINFHVLLFTQTRVLSVQQGISQLWSQHILKPPWYIYRPPYYTLALSFKGFLNYPYPGGDLQQVHRSPNLILFINSDIKTPLPWGEVVQGIHHKNLILCVSSVSFWFVDLPFKVSLAEVFCV